MLVQIDIKITIAIISLFNLCQRNAYLEGLQITKDNFVGYYSYFLEILDLIRESETVVTPIKDAKYFCGTR